jgi:hypothetical protein
MIRLFVFSSSLLLLFSCYRPSQPQAFEDMKMLEGKWVSVEGVQFSESWKVVHDSLIEGVGYSMNNNDTVFTEQLKIYRMGNYVLYGAKVGGNEDYVHFRLTEARKGKWTFVNPVHDYPNVIEYIMKDENSLIARTSNLNGNKVVEFKLKKEIE